VGLATSLFHPRVARFAEQLDEARDSKEAAVAAYELLRIDAESARDVVADFAARSPLMAFDRKHLVLLILDGSSGRVHEVISEKVMPTAISKVRTSLTLGDPPTLWSGLFRLPDGAVAADEGEGGERASFILRAKDPTCYYLFTFGFQDARLDWERSTMRDVKDAELRRWKASDWWPKDWQ
jgi:hypothetical protein